MEMKIPTDANILGNAITDRPLSIHEAWVDDHSATLGSIVKNSKYKVIITFLTSSHRENITMSREIQSMSFQKI